jgi:hypothetical protein
MPAPTRKSITEESWAEYRLLILAELERLDECVERLREQDNVVMRESRQEIARTCRKVATSLHGKIDPLIKRIDILESQGKEDSHSDKRKDRWAFWTAVITIIGSLIVSLISLAMAWKSGQ